MKELLLFLDIDGVMVLAKGYKLPKLLEDGFPEFNNNSCNVINKIISQYNTTIILTTSHRLCYSIDEWKIIFSKRNITIENINYLNSKLENISRKQEIENWFSINTAKNFVIIDDDKSLNDLTDTLKDHLILTSPYVGLTEYYLKDIELILEK